MFSESHLILKSENLRILFEDSMKEGRRIKIKDVLPLLQVKTWRILWLLIFLGSVLLSI